MSILRPGSQLVVATHNTGKMEEIAALFADHPISLLSAADLGLAVPEETETSFVGNARIKAHAAAQATGLAALSDDSGLEVDCLGGLPGVWTADWAETPTGRDFDAAMQRVHSGVLSSGAAAPWFARFRCCLVLALPDGSDHIFEGKIEGSLTFPGRGDFGHGYDPIFIAQGGTKTFGELDRWTKNKMSHRGQAFAAMIRDCFT